MKTTRNIEITVEREEVLIVRKTPNPVTAWCAECGKQVRTLTREEAMAVTAARRHERIGRVESPDIHTTETPDGCESLWEKTLIP